MILRELFYFDRDTAKMSQDNSYMQGRDVDKLNKSDTRKTRLTLGQINELRRATDMHVKEQQAELAFITRMYAAPAEAEL